MLAACQTSAPASHPGAVSSSGGAVSAISGVRPDIARPPSSGGDALPSTAELSVDPSRFKGLSGSDITALLGAPSFQRHDGDAEIWQYYGPSSSCVLDLFVYPEQGQPRVAHAELRSRGAGNASVCLAQILEGKRG